jgi:hypothetical protein
VGLGLGDRFEAFRGGSGSPEGGVLQAEKPAELQENALSSAGCDITQQQGEASMVRRGSTVRVRQRASRKTLQMMISGV